MIGTKIYKEIFSLTACSIFSTIGIIFSILVILNTFLTCSFRFTATKEPPFFLINLNKEIITPTPALSK